MTDMAELRVGDQTIQLPIVEGKLYTGPTRRPYVPSDGR